MKNRPAPYARKVRVKAKQVARKEMLIKGFQAFILVTCALLLSA